MRYLGIDYGEKRIGLALSDESGRLAFPLKTLVRGKGGAGTFLRDLARVVVKEKVGAIVVGLPLDSKSVAAKQAGEVKEFAALLQKVLELPIELENEIFTTRIAERHTRKAKADEAAAALILQSFLDKLSRGSGIS